MNGYQIGDKSLKVSTVTPGMNSMINQQNNSDQTVSNLDLDEESGKYLKLKLKGLIFYTLHNQELI